MATNRNPDSSLAPPLTTGLLVADRLGSDVEIRNWPLIDAGWVSGLIVAGTLTVCGIATWQSASWPMGLLATAALMASMSRFWCPVVFRFDMRGFTEATRFHRRAIAWREVTSCVVQNRGILLSFWREDRRRRETTRFVEWHAQRDELLALLQQVGRLTDNEIGEGQLAQRR